MLKSKHCEICENQIIDKRTGTKCSLTNDKPNFKNKCDKITFEDKHEQKIVDTNIEFETLQRQRMKVISKAIGLISVGVAIMLAGVFLGIFAFEGGVISTYPLIIIGVGFLTVPKALHPLVIFNQSLAVAKSKKTELDQLLVMYNIKYDLKLDFIEDRHGNIDINPNLTFTRKHYR